MFSQGFIRESKLWLLHDHISLRYHLSFPSRLFLYQLSMYVGDIYMINCTFLTMLIILYVGICAFIIFTKFCLNCNYIMSYSVFFLVFSYFVLLTKIYLYQLHYTGSFDLLLSINVYSLEPSWLPSIGKRKIIIWWFIVMVWSMVYSSIITPL